MTKSQLVVVQIFIFHYQLHNPKPCRDAILYRVSTFIYGYIKNLSSIFFNNRRDAQDAEERKKRETSTHYLLPIKNCIIQNPSPLSNK